ncbi:MAG: thiamine-phosphate kinase [Pyrinomonadaceae bacterium]
MVSEFEFIDNIKSKYGLNKIGDDCAVLPNDAETDLLITADMLVEDIDFRLDWTTPGFLGHKALTVSLSDIAAMGGRPVWSMLSIGVPETLWKTDFIDRFYAGWHSHAKESNVELVGGDISRTTDKLVIDSIVCGKVPKGKAILRSGAIVGDAIVVTDHVGGAAGGLKLLESGRRLGPDLASWEEVLLSIHLKPWPQTGTGIYLEQAKLAHSMIDISDGLASDLQHICEASNVGARLHADKIPLNLNLHNLCDSYDEQLDIGLNGGEDFQLLFTLPIDKFPELSSNMFEGKDYGMFSVIGEITANIGIIEFIGDKKITILTPKGFRHF